MQKLLRGTASGALATLAMSAIMYAAKRAGMLGEPPPRKITRSFVYALGVHPKRRSLDLASLAAHVGFGAGMGGLYGLAKRRRSSRFRAAGAGLLYGAAIWTLSYAGWVPSLGIMAQPAHDRPGRPTAMLAAHAVYGAVLAELVNDLSARGMRGASAL